MTMAEGLGVTPVYNLDGGNNSEGFGGGGFIWMIFLFFLLAWGGDGFGGRGNASAQTALNGINNDFMYSNLSNQLRDNSIQSNSILESIRTGLCQNGYDALNHARETQMTIMNGNNATQMAIMQGNNAIQSEIASCCCTTQKELLINRYEAEKNTAEIVNAVNAQGQMTRDLMTQNTIQDLRDRLQSTEFGLSQVNQNATLIAQIRPYPIPAYPTCSPYTPYSGCMGSC